MSESLAFSFVIDPAEQVRASQAMTRRQRFAWLRNLVLPAAAVFPLLLARALGVPRAQLWPYLVIFFAIALYAALYPALLRRQARRAIAQTPSLTEPQTYRFTRDSLQVSNSLASGELRWEAVVEAAETREFLLLYYSRKCAYYLPTRILGAQLDDVRRFVRERLGPRANEVPDPAAAAPVA